MDAQEASLFGGTGGVSHEDALLFRVEFVLGYFEHVLLVEVLLDDLLFLLLDLEVLSI